MCLGTCELGTQTGVTPQGQWVSTKADSDVQIAPPSPEGGHRHKASGLEPNTSYPCTLLFCIMPTPSFLPQDVALSSLLQEAFQDCPPQQAPISPSL